MTRAHLQRVAQIFNEMQMLRHELHVYAFNQTPYDETAIKVVTILREGNDIMGKQFTEITLNGKFTD